MVLTWAFTYPSAFHVVEIIYYEVYDDTGTACEFNFTNEYLEGYLKKSPLQYLFILEIGGTNFGGITVYRIKLKVQRLGRNPTERHIANSSQVKLAVTYNTALILRFNSDNYRPIALASSLSKVL